MDCTRQLFGLQWDQHAFRRQVSKAETLTARETDMWGRVWTSEYVVCHTEQVCDRCGETRPAGACTCDTERAEHCAIRLACIEAAAR